MLDHQRSIRRHHQATKGTPQLFFEQKTFLTSFCFSLSSPLRIWETQRSGEKRGKCSVVVMVGFHAARILRCGAEELESVVGFCLPPPSLSSACSKVDGRRRKYNTRSPFISPRVCLSISPSCLFCSGGGRVIYARSLNIGI